MQISSTQSYLHRWMNGGSVCWNLGFGESISVARYCRGLPSAKSFLRSEDYHHFYHTAGDQGDFNYAYWAGVGIFHSGVQVHGVEYAFGVHDYPSSGVFEVEPRQCPGFKFRRSILIGTTCLDPVQVREFMELHAANYHGDTYHLIVKNCNHYYNDICYRLTGNPGWVNRLAKLGSM
ncbi:putative PPPDE peptidase domain, PPPDE putative peptidase domain superfamily [Helianthus annuus]|uniref:PPPDE putative peptidase domain-containing protein n=1 Tax=Helianthus annuus TaxID=4232 RepID=A0A251V2X9_HELAN|nr:deSI-like protein At4g17486 [Helianthus annuus]XP_022036379.1 deSI-like protein At4g17486 [Helianthus annuus]XP_035844738.1 deSI-like protein At4g17486 [Helianthus annuus]XP_035844739.1 deSI-like protein At4g17486 [Helianthus annuus]XP_035844740.1 deSI-like protein At4g17486 [Helianthus annuus]XP_035844741.1 deSI-like protein At4g17486 [Helianthus annuus]XP_035844742.1 deSI-like protein At4g17486 [Helianthus annuus]XP_035844743.1 deSI-like protein At4g17486 [Helianthus annuus]XP_03584474